MIETAGGRERLAIGYLVLTIGYSLERGGRDAFIDELYVRAERRGRGLGALAVATAEAAARRLGVRAVHLEVDPPTIARDGSTSGWVSRCASATTS